MTAMNSALDAMGQGKEPTGLMEFAQLREIVGFPAYDRELEQLIGVGTEEGKK